MPVIENCTSLNEIRDNIEARDSSELFIRNNNIDALKDVFRVNYTTLETLQLSENGIRKIHKSTFKNLENLKHLDLSVNRVRRIDERLFRMNLKLVYLDLSHNRLLSVENDDFRYLIELQTLKLADNMLAKFENFSFPSLLKLNLSSNQLWKFRNVKLPKVLKLDLSRNRFTKLKEFKLSQTLEILNMEKNCLKKITQNSFEKLTHLNKLNLSDNLLKVLPDGLFLDLVALEQLNLSNNQLRRVQTSWFKNMNLLKELKLDNNSITEIDENAFDNLIRLEMFLMDNQKSNSNDTFLKIPENFFQNCTNLKVVSFRNAKLSEIGECAFSNLNRLTSLRLQDNLLKKLPECFLPTNTFNIELVDLSNNPLDYTNEAFSLRKQNEIENLNLRNTVTFKSNRFDFSKISQLRHLNLNDSDLSHSFDTSRKKTVENVLDPSRSNSQSTFIAHPIFARPLFLKGNVLTHLLLAHCRILDIPINFFENLKLLVWLDLSYNQLCSLNRCLEPLIKLKTLFLNNNTLYDPIIEEFYANTNLVELDLRRNEIKEITDLMVDSIPNIKYDPSCSIIHLDVFDDI